jgi:hypothetical protein
MSLVNKTLLFVGLTFVFLFGVFYYYSRALVLHRFSALERQDTEQNIQRALSAIQDDPQTSATLPGTTPRGIGPSSSHKERVPTTRQPNYLLKPLPYSAYTWL